MTHDPARRNTAAQPHTIYTRTPDTMTTGSPAITVLIAQTPPPAQPLARPSAPAALLAAEIEAARQQALDAKADNTKRAYKADWNHFVDYCERRSVAALPAHPDTIAAYVTYLAAQLGYKMSTIRRRVATISQAHQYAHLESPTGAIQVRETLRGLAKKYKIAETGKAALSVDDLRAMLKTTPASIEGIRDRAILLIGFAGAYRRSEIVSLDYEDIELKRDGVIILLRHSKTDQEGQGTYKAIPYGRKESTCPVRALKKWLEAAAIKTGPIFKPINIHHQIADRRLGDRAVARLVKKYAQAAGLDPKKYSGHSLRSGFVTAFLEEGGDLYSAGRQAGHKDERTTKRYDKRANLFKNNPVYKLNL